MKQVFISQAMKGLSDEAIQTAREEAIAKLDEVLGVGCYEVIDSFFKGINEELATRDELKSKPLYCMGKSLQKLAEADLCVFIGDWRAQRGCTIEHICCEQFGIDILDL